MRFAEGVVAASGLALSGFAHAQPPSDLHLKLDQIAHGGDAWIPECTQKRSAEACKNLSDLYTKVADLYMKIARTSNARPDDLDTSIRYIDLAKEYTTRQALIERPELKPTFEKQDAEKSWLASIAPQLRFHDTKYGVLIDAAPLPNWVGAYVTQVDHIKIRNSSQLRSMITDYKSGPNNSFGIAPAATVIAQYNESHPAESARAESEDEPPPEPSRMVPTPTLADVTAAFASQLAARHQPVPERQPPVAQRPASTYAMGSNSGYASSSAANPSSSGGWTNRNSLASPNASMAVGDKTPPPDYKVGGCISPSGSPGMQGITPVSNRCSFRVHFTFCWTNVSQSSWADAMRCENNQFGSDDAGPGGTVGITGAHGGRLFIRECRDPGLPFRQRWDGGSFSYECG
ncbi:hypothetical protein ACFSCW_09695 [Sphingomonas tabacisoli]|uniref:Uncharacterized protein n=1 Tax=Sphingomonas tabacisoli TaxID=2249466 RepID=A0ABW4I3E7_9SPHN